MVKIKAAVVAVAKTPAVQKEAVVLLRLAAVTLAAKYGLNVHF